MTINYYLYEADISWSLSELISLSSTPFYPLREKQAHLLSSTGATRRKNSSKTNPTTTKKGFYTKEKRTHKHYEKKTEEFFCRHNKTRRKTPSPA